jgi:hypothetical protein
LQEVKVCALAYWAADNSAAAAKVERMVIDFCLFALRGSERQEKKEEEMVKKVKVKKTTTTGLTRVMKQTRCW